VSDVKSAGPILRPGNTLLTQMQRQTDVRAHPKIPSEGRIPEDLDATPMGCLDAITPGESVTVSLYSLPDIGD
jgi:hypothetical protein